MCKTILYSKAINNQRGQTMKSYQVELKRTSYVNMNIEAESLEEAEALAWSELASDNSWGEGDANWELQSIEATA
jgi:hypothetical protein